MGNSNNTKDLPLAFGAAPTQKKKVTHIIVKIVPHDAKEPTTVQTYGDTVVIRTTGEEKSIHMSGIYNAYNKLLTTDHSTSSYITEVHIVNNSQTSTKKGILTVICNVRKNMYIRITKDQLQISYKK